MISETSFSRKHSSFWKECTPHMERFVRWTNLGIKERFDLPLGFPETDASRRAYINEVSQKLFDSFYNGKRDFLKSVPKEKVAKTVKEAHAYILTLYGKENIAIDLSDDERKEIALLCDSIAIFFQTEFKGVEIESAPEFSGCGILSSCYGDYVCGSTLIEMKAGERSFRGVDFRQLITYLTLNFLEKKRVIDEICVFNPRLGVHSRIAVTDFIEEVSASTPDDVYSRVEFYLTSNGLSH